jgi:hypothetical protein
MLASTVLTFTRNDRSQYRKYYQSYSVDKQRETGVDVAKVNHADESPNRENGLTAREHVGSGSIADSVHSGLVSEVKDDMRCHLSSRTT